MEKENHSRYTQEGYQALVDELNELKTVKMPKVKEDLARARSFGDLTENSEYDEAKDEQGKIASRIAELEELIQHAIVVRDRDFKRGIVNLGCTVTVYDYDFDEEVTYTIVGSNEADAMNGKISDQSPLGAAMMNSKEGDEISYQSPAGLLKVKIVKVEKTEK
ncbi:MAG: transcription elongation factor GreA [Clostridia bacterium]|nr:transcription elongation factor GreA [Clostridia bacterium]